jgi:hypothetical protein
MSPSARTRFAPFPFVGAGTRTAAHPATEFGRISNINLWRRRERGFTVEFDDQKCERFRRFHMVSSVENCGTLEGCWRRRERCPPLAKVSARVTDGKSQ